jgi:hypothetical protein
MNAPEISICLTTGGGRDHFVGGFIQSLVDQDYDLKKAELCVTYAPGSESIFDCLREHIDKFFQVKIAKTDRSKLPFVIPENNPACDINAQICNVASAEKIVRTDFEMRFINPQTLNYISNKLERSGVCVVLPSWHVNEKFSFPEDIPRARDMSAPLGVYSFVCSSFLRSEFIASRGVEEKFALGFAADDSYFHLWWKKNHRLIFGIMEYVVIHLWHGNWKTEKRVKLRDEYTMPLYRSMLERNATPNEDNPGWLRPEMISDIQVWKT